MNTLQEIAGQLLTIGFEGQECGPALVGLLRRIRPGGVIFFQRNIAAVEQFRLLVSQIREVLGDSRPFLAIDQEGGQVDRLRELLGPLPSAREAAQAGMAFELGDLAGRELAVFSLNVDFAPVLDLGSPESGAILGARTGGETPEQVIRFANEFLDGLAGSGVLGCGKHFPGLGGGRKDSHIAMPVIEKTKEALWNEDLAPFRTLAGRLPIIMVAHAWYPELEKSLSPGGKAAGIPTPASLSPSIVTRLLCDQMKYRGLIVCDDLEMGGVVEGRSLEEASVAAVRAGCDILLVCRHAEHVERVHEALVRKAEGDTEFGKQLRQASARVEESKRALAFREPQLTSANLDALRKDIGLVGGEVSKRLAHQPNAVEEKSTEN